MNPGLSEPARGQDYFTLTPAPRLSITHGAAILHDLIAQRAFVIWQSRGCPQGTPQEDWLQAEAEVKAEVANKRRRR